MSKNNELAELLRQMTDLQVRFVAERMNTGTDTEACERVGIDQRSVTRWKAAGVPIEEAVKLVRIDGVIAGREMLRRLVSHAVQTLATHMRSRNARVSLDAAIEVLDRVGLTETLVVDAGDNLAELIREFRSTAPSIAKSDDHD